MDLLWTYYVIYYGSNLRIDPEMDLGDVRFGYGTPCCVDVQEGKMKSLFRPTYILVTIDD